MAELIETYDCAPSALNFMSRAIVRVPRRLSEDGSFPRIAVRWTGLRIEPAQLQAFGKATGIAEKGALSILFPHVFGFRLHMALLTHRAYPLPIWKALQIRNRLVGHTPIDPRATMDMETKIGGHRLVDKGVEVELVSRLMCGSVCQWESRVSYFYRGRFGAPPPLAPRPQAPSLAAAPVVDRFLLPSAGGWVFARLTGDYNGIHQWRWYARRFGFPAAFLHPQRVAGMCLAKLHGPDSDAQTLDLWIKGPLFYGANVLLQAAHGEDGLRFGLSLDGDPRAALAGNWRRGSGGDA